MTLYLVRNQSGQFFRAKGYGRSGDSWVGSMERARIYTKIGPAKSTVTFFARAYPEFDTPQILAFELDPSQGKVIEQADRVSKIIAAKGKRDAKLKKGSGNREIKYLEEQINSINQRMAALKNA